MWEAALFKSQLGASWKNVHPDIQERFDADPVPEQPIYFDGLMTKLDCSGLGMLLAHISSYFTTGALCPHRGTNVSAEFEVYKITGSDDIYKIRRYCFSSGKTYIFRSRMHATTEGELLEFVGGGFGMLVRVQEKEGALFFTEGGYFIGGNRWRLRLPALLSPGKVALTHANLDRNRFRISIRITHPLFGLLYDQEGVFSRRYAA